jgi:glutamate-1-semialdehyde 2,1-aminomutase
MNIAKSEQAFDLAKKYIPGGVNSPVRSFRSVGGTPRFIHHARGSKIIDIDGNEYIDYVSSWGPAILGHAHDRVLDAITKAAQNGLTFGAPTEAETTLARLITSRIKSVELVRLVNSGTEAVMSALRLARGYTGRNKIVKMIGGYHGHVDQLLVQAGSGLATLGLPDSAGIASEQASLTILVPYNDLEAVQKAFNSFGEDIAAIIVEPVAGNMGVITPVDGYLAGLRKICDQYESLLIFDEVITGFRVSQGGAQQLFGIDADITTLGKIIGGGLPIGAYGGKRHIMEKIAPLGPVYQAGTLSGNPVAVAAGIATLEALADERVYAKLEYQSDALAVGLEKAAQKTGIPYKINRLASMMTGFFTDQPVTSYADVLKTDKKRYNSFFHKMLNRGVYLAPSAFEAMFVSLAHTPDDIQRTIDLAGKSFEELADEL